MSDTPEILPPELPTELPIELPPEPSSSSEPSPLPPALPPLPPREYWCFISHRLADNEEPGRQWAAWLQQALETYEVPADLVGTKNERGDIIPERIFPIFRAGEEPAEDATALPPATESALLHSRFLLVLCSPLAVQSPFVGEEILRFKQLGKHNRILAAILAGEPNKSGAETECFPKPLRFTVDAQGDLTEEPVEPVAADFRLPNGTPGWTSPVAFREALKGTGLTEDQITARVNEFVAQQKLMLLKIIGGVLGVPANVLTRREKSYQLQLAQQRATKSRTLATVLGILALLGIAGAATALWFGQEARKQADLAQGSKMLMEVEKGNAQRETARTSASAATALEAAEKQRTDALHNQKLAEEQEAAARADVAKAKKNLDTLKRERTAAFDANYKWLQEEGYSFGPPRDSLTLAEGKTAEMEVQVSPDSEYAIVVKLEDDPDFDADYSVFEEVPKEGSKDAESRELSSSGPRFARMFHRAAGAGGPLTVTLDGIQGNGTATVYVGHLAHATLAAATPKVKPVAAAPSVSAAPAAPTAPSTPAAPVAAAPPATETTATGDGRAFLGVKCSEDGRMIVIQVVPHSPAELAGLQLNDRITAIDLKPLPHTKNPLPDVLAEYRPGEPIEIGVLRGKVLLFLKARLANMDGSQPARTKQP